MRLAAAILALSLLAPSAAAADPPKPKKPTLTLRVLPRFGRVATSFLFTAILEGGEDSEALHCLVAEWNFGSDDTSLAEPDCDPFEAGKTKLERQYGIERRFPSEGQKTVSVTLRKGDKVIARASTGLRVLPESGLR